MMFDDKISIPDEQHYADATQNALVYSNKRDSSNTRLRNNCIDHDGFQLIIGLYNRVVMYFFRYR